MSDHLFYTTPPHLGPSRGHDASSGYPFENTSFSAPTSRIPNVHSGHVMTPILVVKMEGVSTVIVDEEGYSDDDGESDDNPWLEASRVTHQNLPSSLRYHRVATTGKFSPRLNDTLGKEITARGGIPVEKVDADTTVLLAPHPFARSTKAHKARVLGIPIMDEAAFLKLPLVQPEGWGLQSGRPT